MHKQLVYYQVPKKHKSSQLFNTINEEFAQDDVIEIVLTDPIKPLTIKSIFHPQQFFVDDIEFTSSLLWSLRMPLLSNLDGHNAFKIISINDMISGLENHAKNGVGWIIAFRKDKRTIRAVINDNLESLIIVTSRSEINDTETILNKCAVEESYNKYEMGDYI